MSDIDYFIGLFDRELQDEFDHIQNTSIEHDKLLSENTVLKITIDEKDREIQALRSELENLKDDFYDVSYQLSMGT